MMDYELSEEHLMIQKTIRAFVKKEFTREIILELDEKQEFASDPFKKMAELGMLGTCIPTKYGGGGSDLLSVFIIHEEISRVFPSFAVDLELHTPTVDYGLINRFGTEAQKQKFLPAMCKGEIIGALGMTEPGGGSDVGNFKTKAVKDGEYYILNGSKCFITNVGCPMPCICVVLAHTDKSKGSNGMSTFLVEKDTPGFNVGRKHNKLGVRSSQTHEIFLEDCRIPKENLLGNEGAGMKQALMGVNYDRLMDVAIPVGEAQGLLDMTLEYANLRETFGKRLNQREAVQIALAEIYTNIHAARLMGYYVCWLDRVGRTGKEFVVATAMAKHFASHIAQMAAWECMKIYGGHGFMKDNMIEMFFRDNMAIDLGAGPPTILALLIARDLLRVYGIDPFHEK